MFGALDIIPLQEKKMSATAPNVCNSFFLQLKTGERYGKEGPRAVIVVSTPQRHLQVGQHTLGNETKCGTAAPMQLVCHDIGHCF